MAVYNKRIRFLFYLLSQTKGYLRSLDLAKRANVTERTIKSDIPELSEYAKDAGAELISKKGKGYTFKIINEEKYNHVKKQLYIHFSSTQLDLILIRSSEILRKIIVHNHYMTVDDLADEMYLTRNSLREEMKIVTDYLNKYNLSWKKKNDDGPLIQGKELDRRMMMICAFETPYHEAVRLYKDDNFLAWFNYNEESRYEIRRIFLKTLRESDCHLRDEHTLRFSWYLCLMINRIKAACIVTFTEEERKYIRSLRQNQVAHRIFFNLYDYSDYHELPEDEILAFALLLAEYADISPDCNIDLYYPNQMKEARKFLADYEFAVFREYGIHLSDFTNAYDVLIRALIPLMIQKDFQATDQDASITSIKDIRVQDSSLAVQMAFDAVYLFKEKYGKSLALDRIVTISDSIQSLLLSVNYEFQPVRALLYGWGGLRMGTIVADIIQSRYKNCFEEIKVCELYEMRGIEQKDYDFVILALNMRNQVSDFAYNYNWPYMFVNAIPTQRQMNELYNQYILNGVRLNSILNHLNLKYLGVYTDSIFESDSAFIDLISYKYGKDSESIKSIQKSLKFRFPICAYKHCCALFIKHHFVSGNIFDVYHLKSEMKICGETVSYIIVISMDFNSSLQAARFINDAVYMLFNDEMMIKRIIDNPQPETLIKLVRESLKALPISLN